MKAIALISGGLDSLLAARIVRDQGVHIIPVKFNTPFYQLNVNKYHQNVLPGYIMNYLGERLNDMDMGKDFLSLILKPKYGFGAHLNPCIDCKIAMLIKARELMPQLRARFVVTGEVLGQRPMSQHKRALYSIEKESGLKGLLLRPLSAKVLDPTIPEEKGWVKRDKLFDIVGRSRRVQISLAREFGISGYPNAAGGCLLTDRQFSSRLRDLISHRELSLRNIELLKFGRHFRIGEHTKLVVGRNEKENKYLEENAKIGDLLFTPEERVAGPTCLGAGPFDKEMIYLASGIARSYSDCFEDGLRVIYRRIPVNKKIYLSAPCINKDKAISLLV